MLLSKRTGEKSLPVLDVQPTSLTVWPVTLENNVNESKLSIEM